MEFPLETPAKTLVAPPCAAVAAASATAAGSGVVTVATVDVDAAGAFAGGSLGSGTFRARYAPGAAQPATIQFISSLGTPLKFRASTLCECGNVVSECG